MAIKTRAQIQAQSNTTYIDNTVGSITPTSVRSLNDDWTDSTVFLTDTGSLTVATSSVALTSIVTASFDDATDTLTFTKGNGTTFSILIPDISGSAAISTGSLLLTASIANSTITFTKGDNTTFSITVNNVANAVSSSFAATASFALNAGTSINTGSFATTGSNTFTGTQTIQNANLIVSTGSLEVYDTVTYNQQLLVNSAGVTAPLQVNTPIVSSTSGDLTLLAANPANKIVLNNEVSAIGQSIIADSFTGSLNGNATSATSALTATSSSFATSASVANFANTSTSASLIDIFTDNGNTEHRVLFADATTDSSGNQVLIDPNATFTYNANQNRLTVQNLNVPGTASFGYTQTITGSAVVIGQQFIVLNTDTPTQQYAGIQVYDSGSALTASLEWDGNTDNWIVVEETGLSAGILTGPTGSKGSEVFPTVNTLIKGTGHHTVSNSNITDNGSVVSINSNTQITGSTDINGSALTLNNGRASVIGTFNAPYSLNAPSIYIQPASSGSTTNVDIRTIFTESIAQTNRGGNLIMATGLNTATGSFIISGSRNIINLANAGGTNTQASQGRRTGFQGSGNIVLARIFTTGSQTGILPTLTNAFFAADTEIVNNSGAGITIQNSSINNIPTVTANSGSNISFSNANVQSPIAITNNWSGSNFNLVNSGLFGQSVVITNDDIPTAPTGTNVLSNTGLLIVGGGLVPANSIRIHVPSGSSNTTQGGLKNSVIAGTGLIVSSSTNHANTTVLSDRSINVFGSYNTNDNITNNPTNVRFAVATGTSNTVRRTSLYVSASGETVVSGSLIAVAGVTGSLLGTASFANNATTASHAVTALSSSYALTASFALNAGTSIDTGSFATTGSNTFIGNQTIQNGNLTITGSLEVYDAINTQQLLVDGSGVTAPIQVNTPIVSSISGDLTLVASGGGNKISLNSDVSAAGKTIIADVFSGSLSGNANTATSASYAVTASYALNGGGGGGIQGNEIYSYTFLLMGA